MKFDYLVRGDLTALAISTYLKIHAKSVLKEVNDSIIMQDILEYLHNTRQGHLITKTGYDDSPLYSDIKELIVEFKNSNK